MARCCFKQGCELEVQYVCLCLSFETYCCEFHLQVHLKLPNRTHTFNSIFTEPPEGTKEIILRYLAKEKSKKEKLKKIALASLGQNWNNRENSIEEVLKELDSDLKEISFLIEKISQTSEKEEEKVLNSLTLQHYSDAGIGEAMISKNSEAHTRARLLCRLGQLKNKRDEIINRTYNDPETEQQFRKTCLIYENSASDPLFRQYYEEYINSYYKLTSCFLIDMDQDRIKSNLYIYNTEHEQEEIKVFEIPEKIDYYSLLIQLPNGELFIIGTKEYSYNAFIIDRNYKFRKLPCSVTQACYTAVYFNRNVYCFGGEDGLDRLYWNWRFDLDENRRYELASIQKDNDQCFNCLIFNGNILISILGSCNIYFYSIDIDSFSKIPFNFTDDDKWLIKAEEKLYLIEWEGWIYESGVEDEYAWKRISKSNFKVECPKQVYYSYNKGAIYISLFDSDNSRLYYKFDLNRKALIDIALYFDDVTLKRAGDKLETINCYDQTFRFNPDPHAAYINKGFTLYYLFKNLRSLESWNEDIKSRPDNVIGWSCKGGVLYDLERYAEAIECYNESLRLNPENVKEYHNKANALIKLGRNLEAYECFNEAIRLEPNSDYVYFKKGIAITCLGLPLESIECFNESVRLNPNYIDAYMGKGLALYKLKRNLEAIEAFNEVIRIESGYNDAWVYKGVALNKLDRNIEAIECYNEALKLKPDDACAYINKGIALSKLRRNVEAIECYNETIKFDPENMNAFIRKGFALIDLGQNHEAINCYNEAIKLKPDAENYLIFGVALSHLGKNFEAIEFYNESIKLEPKCEETYFRKGHSHAVLGQHLEAIKCYSESIKLKPDDATAHNNKGVSLNYVGKDLEALDCYNEAIKLEPEKVDVYINKGETLISLERYIEAIECYSEAIKLKPDEFQFYVRRANILSMPARQREDLQRFKNNND